MDNSTIAIQPSNGTAQKTSIEERFERDAARDIAAAREAGPAFSFVADSKNLPEQESLMRAIWNLQKALRDWDGAYDRLPDSFPCKCVRRRCHFCRFCEVMHFQSDAATLANVLTMYEAALAGVLYPFDHDAPDDEDDLEDELDDEDDGPPAALSSAQVGPDSVALHVHVPAPVKDQSDCHWLPSCDD